MSDDKQSQRGVDIDNAMMLWGAFFGMVIGGLVTLFTAPKNGKENREQISQAATTAIRQIETAVPTDPVKESLAEGRAAARRRRNTMSGSRD